MAELRRCEAFGIPYLVSHPGNYMDDRSIGIARNAAAYTRCLRAVPGSPMVLLETTAGLRDCARLHLRGIGTLRHAIADDVRHRVAYLCRHLPPLLRRLRPPADYDGVWQAWDEILGLDKLLCLHLNDSKTKFASRRDRHELIGEGSLGPSSVPPNHD